MEPWERASKAATVLAAFFAMIGLIVSGWFSWQSAKVSGESLHVSKDAYSLARSSAQSALASKFYLGEAPRDLEPPDRPIRAVVNATPVAIYQVWVEGTAASRPAMVRIWTVQGCTGYRLPTTFQAKTVHFFDGQRSWSRMENGELQPEHVHPVPQDNARGSKLSTLGRPFDVPGCA